MLLDKPHASSLPCLAFVLFFLPSPILCQSSSGFSFLKISVDAKSEGLSGAYTAMSNNVTSLYWNPAGLAWVNKKEVLATHSEWLLGSRFDFLGVGIPLSKFKGSLGLGVSMLSQKEQEGRDEQGNKTGSFPANDGALTLALGRKISLSSQWGMGLKLIRSQIASDIGQGLALDLGVRHGHRFNRIPLTLGVSILNLGPGVTFIDEPTKLPLTLAAGLAIESWGAFALSADWRYRIDDQKVFWAAGTQYSLSPGFSLRTGYGITDKTGEDIVSGLGLGFGISLRGYQLDYAFTPMGDLGNAHKFSLGARF